MDELRINCPWDRKQTTQTLRQQTIEELYELTDAITNQDWVAIREELGDLLLHIVFYAKIAQEQSKFSIEEVIRGICEKLIARHPHIYGDVKVKDEHEVKKNWEKLKLKEGKDSVLAGIPRSLPALVKAMRIQEKTSQVGFDWNNNQEVWAKVKEELREFGVAMKAGEEEKMQEEFGDLLFSLVNFSRFIGIDAENSLEKTNLKFIRRFNEVEKRAKSSGKQLQELNLNQLDTLWNEIKASE